MFEPLVARSRVAVRDGQPFVLLPEFHFAWTAAQRLVRPVDRYGWLTTLVGSRGSGKTRLVGKVLTEALDERPQLAFAIQSAEDWLRMLRTEPIPGGAVWPGLIVIEDADRTVSDTHDADLLAHWLDELHRSSVRVLITSSALPSQNPLFTPRLVSRLHAGLSARIPALSEDSRRRFVRESGLQRQLQLADPVASWIAAQPPGTCRSLAKWVERLAQSATPNSVIESLDGLRSDEGEDAATIRPSLTIIAAEVATEFGVPIGDLRSESRDQAMQLPRRCAMWLAHEVRWPMAQIGRYFGRRTHASVSYSCRELARQLADTPTLRDRLARLQMRLADSPREECG
jgi:chromosomal replication initiator protein